MTLPGVSWICPTYGRCPTYQHLLEERIESFLLQEYAGPKELIILNDCPAQTLRMEGASHYVIEDGYGTPQSQDRTGRPVKIFNCRFRFASLGEKYNALVRLAAHDLLMPAEDDDLHLPWAISQAVRALGYYPIAEGGHDTTAMSLGYWKSPQVWYMDARGLHWQHSVGVRHHAGIFHRVAWQKAGGYPHTSGAQDAVFDQKLGGHLLPAAPAGIDPSEYAYVYRWGVQPHHLSGTLPHDDFYRQVGSLPVAAGTFTLRPHWREDYVALTRRALPTPAARAGCAAGSP